MRYLITAYPDAIQYGHIDIPDGEDAFKYIGDHFSEIEFEKPMLTYDMFEIQYEPECEEV